MCEDQSDQSQTNTLFSSSNKRSAWEARFYGGKKNSQWGLMSPKCQGWCWMWPSQRSGRQATTCYHLRRPWMCSFEDRSEIDEMRILISDCNQFVCSSLGQSFQRACNLCIFIQGMVSSNSFWQILTGCDPWRCQQPAVINGSVGIGVSAEENLHFNIIAVTRWCAHHFCKTPSIGTMPAFSQCLLQRVPKSNPWTDGPKERSQSLA